MVSTFLENRIQYADRKSIFIALTFNSIPSPDFSPIRQLLDFSQIVTTSVYEIILPFLSKFQLLSIRLSSIAKTIS